LSFRPVRKQEQRPVVEHIVAPPGAVSSYCASPENNGTGPFFRYLFPVDGTITRLQIDIGTLSKDETAIVEVAQSGPVGERLNIEIAGGGVQKIPGNFTVKAGDKVVLSIVQPEVGDIWFAFVYQFWHGKDASS